MSAQKMRKTRKYLVQEQNAIMLNDIKTDVTGEIAKTATELVSQLSPNVSTTAPEESISAITSKETEFKNSESGETNNTVNSLLNDSSVKPLENTEKLKFYLVEEVTPKIPKEEHSQSSNGSEMSVTMQLHPKRRILKAIDNKSKYSDISSSANITAIETNPSSTNSELAPFTNYHQMFLNIRKQVDKRRKNLFSVKPKPPFGFEIYLMNRRTYILDGTYKNSVLNAQISPPTNIHEQLKKLFVEQEKDRQKLRLQHIVEKEKLVLCIEQEILRVHGRAVRTLTDQPIPFSVCTILMGEEVYNIMTPEQEKEKDTKSHSHCNGRTFLSWLQEVDDKWEKIRKSLLLRHKNEAGSLHAVQKMDWGWKLKELRLCTHSNPESNIDDEHVPMVLVIDDFFHFPA